MWREAERHCVNVCVPCGVFCLYLSVSITLHSMQFNPFKYINAIRFMNISREIWVELYVWVLWMHFICSLEMDYLLEDLRVRWDCTLMCLLEYTILKQMDSSIALRAGLHVTPRLCLKSLFPLLLRQQQDSSLKAINTIQSRLVFPKALYLNSGKASEKNGLEGKRDGMVFPVNWKRKSWGRFLNGTDLPADTWWQLSLI